jgi:hypothetical protein
MSFMSTLSQSLKQFHWDPQPQAETLIRELIETFLSKNRFARELGGRMKEETGTRFQDWVETIVAPDSTSLRQRLAKVGYETWRDRSGEPPDVFANPNGMFPRIRIQDTKESAIHLKVGSVADFADVWRIKARIEGEPCGPYRRVLASDENDTRLIAAERWGYTGYEIPAESPAQAIAMQRQLEAFLTRERNPADDGEGFSIVARLIDSSDLDIDIQCALFFEAERRYWQRRNRAAQVQKARQDALGLGWANHDHHTYRSSRRHFKSLVAIWEKFGFHCRERFYAGREAGWGAQVMEQPYTGIITFNDVDLTPDELMGDFSHDGLTERDRLGTVGLWCALHGEAFLQAGMHHLEAMFDFDSLREQLEAQDVKVMKPFTNFPYLRQAFTEGERWKVAPGRIKRLLDEKLITPEQAKQFREQGAIGSHLENLERNDGFKGFNQTGVSQIIAETDPRKQLQPV